ncbi:unnamed protein product [Cuscuta campestris]|uniref:Uncharacterized protein n=1 Tax=Cuscuta campestris TaxID=132261 RepID=A0A484N934_9ASTE|nr:unnamed protein product [Cuscuta campestris]
MYDSCSKSNLSSNRMKPSSTDRATETTCSAEEEEAQVEASTSFFCGEAAGRPKDEEDWELEVQDQAPEP